MAFKDLHTIHEMFDGYSKYEGVDLSKVIKDAGRLKNYLEMKEHDRMLRGLPKTRAQRVHENRLKRARRVEGLVRGQH